jgi:hypothetical protein
VAREETPNSNVINPISPSSFQTITSSRHPEIWSPWQSLFLGRLSRLLRQEEEWRLRVPDTDWRLRLIHRAIYSTYCDCAASECAADARELVRRHRGSSQT